MKLIDAAFKKKSNNNFIADEGHTIKLIDVAFKNKIYHYLIGVAFEKKSCEEKVDRVEHPSRGLSYKHVVENIASGLDIVDSGGSPSPGQSSISHLLYR